MTTPRLLLAAAVLATGCALFAYAGTSLLSGPIGFLYRNAPGLNVASNVARLFGALGAAALFVAAAIIALPIAFSPARFVVRLARVLPAFLLLMVVSGVAFTALGIGTVGALIQFGPGGQLPFAATWMGGAGLLALIAVSVAAAVVAFDPRFVKPAFVATVVAAVLVLVAAIAMLAGAAIVATSQPSLPTGGPGGPPPGQGAGPPPGGPAGPPGQGGGPNGVANFVAQFQIGSVLMSVLALGGLVAALFGVRALGGISAATPDAPRATVRGQVAPVLLSGVVLALIGLIAIQFIPVSRTNPPAQAAVVWDSPRTQALVSRACMDCHSNETKWPLYATIAPGSWLTMGHVAAARRAFNLSDFTRIPANQRSRRANDMEERINDGAMPPSDYLILHPEARLSDVEKEQLIEGLQISLNR